VSIVTHNCINDFINASSFIGGSIHIVDWNQLGKLAGQQPCPVNKVLVNEVSSGTSVNHSFGSSLLHGVHHFEVN
jgi:hypothetical protein